MQNLLSLSCLFCFRLHEEAPTGSKQAAFYVHCESQDQPHSCSCWGQNTPKIPDARREPHPQSREFLSCEQFPRLSSHPLFCLHMWATPKAPLIPGNPAPGLLPPVWGSLRHRCHIQEAGWDTGKKFQVSQIRRVISRLMTITRHKNMTALRTAALTALNIPPVLPLTR